MAKITVIVPDGDNCRMCDYLESTYHENAMRMGYITYHCNIFGCTIENGEKCVACRMHTMREGWNDYGEAD